MQPQDDDATPSGPDTRPDIDDIVQHTDSGAGTSQREHWPPNVDSPREDQEPSPPLGERAG